MHIIHKIEKKQTSFGIFCLSNFYMVEHSVLSTVKFSNDLLENFKFLAQA